MNATIRYCVSWRAQRQCSRERCLNFTSLLIALLGCYALTGCQLNETPEQALANMIEEVQATFPDVPTISTDALDDWLADPDRQPPQLLDAREADEFSVSHLPDAIRVDPDADVSELAEKLDPDRPIVVYCSVGYRSSSLARRLSQVTQQTPINLTGSIFKWANEGRPLENMAGQTQRVHPYDNHFGKMVRPELHQQHE